MTVNQLADLLALQNDKTLRAIAQRMVEQNPQRADVLELAIAAAFFDEHTKDKEDADY